MTDIPEDVVERDVLRALDQYFDPNITPQAKRDAFREVLTALEGRTLTKPDPAHVLVPSDWERLAISLLNCVDGPYNHETFLRLRAEIKGKEKST